MNSPFRQAVKWIVAVVLLTTHVGCAIPVAGWKKKQQRDIPLASAENPVFQIVSMWKPAQGLGLDGQVSRGFSGQILFFTQQDPVPAKVTGTVSVVLYEDQGMPLDQDKPIHEFNFAADAWNIYLRETALGPIYSIFVPYERPGNNQAKCHLLVRLSPSDGPVVSSAATAVTLPAKPETAR